MKVCMPQDVTAPFLVFALRSSSWHGYNVAYHIEKREVEMTSVQFPCVGHNDVAILSVLEDFFFLLIKEGIGFAVKSEKKCYYSKFKSIISINV